MDNVRPEVVEEIETLQAIYGEDSFKQLKTTVPWKGVNASVEFQLVLASLDEALRDRVACTLLFKLPSAYPKSAPNVSIKDSVGLSAAALSKLQALLHNQSKQLVGADAPLYEISQSAVDFISDNHAIILGNQDSLITQKDARAAQELQDAEAQEAALRARQEKQQEEHHQTLMKTADEERQRFKALRYHDTATAQSNSAKATPSNVVEHAFVPFVRYPSLQASVYRGGYMGDAVVGTLWTAEAQYEDDRRDALLVQCVDVAKIIGNAQGRKRLAGIEKEVELVQACRHPNLLRVYAAQTITDTSNNSSRLEIALAPYGSTLQDMLVAFGALSDDRLYHILQDVAKGLEALHRRSLCHKCVNPRVIALSSPGAVNHKVQWLLTGCSYQQSLVDLNRTMPFTVFKMPMPEVPQSWQAPDVLKDPLTYTSARDMWDYGVLIAYLLSGGHPYSSWPDPMSFVKQVEEPHLASLLKHLFVPAKQRWTASQVISHLEDSAQPSSATQVPLLSPTKPSAPLMRPMHGALEPDENQKHVPAGSFWQPSSHQAVASRYRAEFEEVEFLGRGGFGKVVKALNKLDRHFYAIKKIRLPADPADEAKLLREVTTWSRLSHPSIVRYHTAWVESDSVTQDAADALQEIELSRTGSPTESTEYEDEDSFHLDQSLSADLDFLSERPSTSLPNIHFGSDSDESSSIVESSVQNSSAAPTPSRSRSRSPFVPPAAEKTLFIQMEFVDGRNLREAIDEGLPKSQAWSILRQVLSAIVHFTSLNIVHRDLKPHNIFLDTTGQVKVGDFGLAVETSSALISSKVTEPVTHSAAADHDLTSGVGTSLYLAPEMVSSKTRSQPKGSSVSSIDMYSLGIVFFEMMYPIKTRMERLKIISNLRQPSVQLPPDWSGHTAEADIIRKLLSHDPAKRPTAKALLESDFLPPAAVEQRVAEVVRLLEQPRSSQRPVILQAIFNPPREDLELQDYLFDSSTSNYAETYVNTAKSRLASVFELRGASELSVDLVTPACPQFYRPEDGKRPVKYVDENGILVQLPYDHTVPFARKIAREGIARHKRYCIAPVYRRREAIGGQPRAPLVASFDLVSEALTFAAEAECIQTVDSALQDFGIPGYTHLVGHTAFLDFIVKDVPPNNRRGVLRFLELASNKGIGLTQKQLLDLAKVPGVTRRTLDTVSSLNKAFDPTSSVEELRELAASHPLLRAAIQDLRELLRYCKLFEVQCPVLCYPLLAVNYHFHYAPKNSVLFFQTTMMSKAKPTTIAIGGRYDNVVQHFRPPDRRTSGRLVSVSIALALLARSVEQEQEDSVRKLSMNRPEAERSYGRYAARRCDVYVASFGQGFFDQRLSILRMLWEAGIRADVQYEGDTASPEQMLARRRQENVLYLVLVKHHGGREPTCKVRAVLKAGEEEVPQTELAEFLRERIAEQNRVDAAAFGAPLRDPATTPLSQISGYPKDRAIGAERLQLIAPELNKRQLGRRRAAIADRASSNITSQLNTLGELAPIFAVDLEVAVDAVIGYMCSPRWVFHEADWRKLLELAGQTCRASLSELRDELLQYYQQSGSGAMVWLFFLKHNRSVPLVLLP